MAKNDFKPFATGKGANVTSQPDWEALPALLSGFTAGKASSAQVNKALRQASFIAAALAQYTAGKSGQDVLDDGDLSGFIAKMSAAFGKDFQTLDATLTALAGLATGADKLPYFTGNDTAAQTDLTSVGRDIIGKNTIADILTYLGLTEALGNKQNYSQQLTALSGLEIEKDKLPFFNSNNSADITTLTKTGRDIIGKNTVDEVRTLLQLGSAALKTIGTGANQVPDMNAFGVSKNETGYQYLPGGLILQWGRVGPTQAGQNTNVTFTITFPTVAASVICSLDATSLPGKGFGCSSIGVSRTGFGFYVANDSDFNSNSGGFWFAIGY